MRSAIQTELKRIEHAQDLRVLLAVESGSRAWGFESSTSDWDVRFIYVRRPEWYLSIQNRRDVVELQLDGDLDVSGWDFPKALNLFAKSNPPLLEWLRSPIVYAEASSAATRLRELSVDYFSPRACLYHYLHMAEGNYREYLCGDSVRLKKYFYVLRPVLACRWIEAHTTMPPMEFATLVEDQLPAGLGEPVGELLSRKRAGDELAVGPRVPSISDFLDSEIMRLNAAASASTQNDAPDVELLDVLFRSTLSEVWAGE
jgi:predicted nucleotidyltransferase